MGAQFDESQTPRFPDGQSSLWRKAVYEPADGQSQFLPESWIRNGSCYVVWRDVLMDGQLFGHENSYGYRMDRFHSINIDDSIDWALSELILKARQA